MSSDRLVLGYWRIRGLGQPIRLLLRYLEVDFEDKYYDFTPDLTMDNWYADRDKLNLTSPNLPYLLDGETRLTESMAILRYICRTRKPEMLGKTIEDQTNAEVVQYFVCDLWDQGLVKVAYEYTEERLKSYKELEPRKLGYLSKHLGDNSWFAGSEMTYVDFLVYEILDHLRIFDSKCLDNFSNLQEFMKRIEALPAIKAYMESPEFLKGPLYSPTTILKI